MNRVNRNFRINIRKMSSNGGSKSNGSIIRNLNNIKKIEFSTFIRRSELGYDEAPISGF